jgi:hypothetical protein
MTASSRVGMIAALGAALVLALAVLAAPQALARSARSPTATAARACSLAGKYEHLGPTYVERLSVSGTSCSTGDKTVKGYNACRLKAGGAAGHCHSLVMGFRCSEKRTASPVQFVASVTCKKPRQEVSFTYSENL